MTYIRMTGGRDRGYVKDFPVTEAREMLDLGQALPVDFDQPDALGFRELASPVTELQLAENQPPALPVPIVAINPDLANTPAEKFPRLVPFTQHTGKKKR